MKTRVTALLVLTIIVVGCGGKSSSPAPTADVTANNLPPKGIQGVGEKPVSVPDASPREGGVPLYVHFWDGGSYDPDGEIVGWSWLFGDGSGGDAGWHNAWETKGEAWHQYTSPGIKVAHLWVVDNDRNYDVAFVKIEMKQGNNANPIAVAAADPTEGNALLTVWFDASGSYDPDGTLVKYEWDFGEGGGYEDFTDTGGVASHEYAAEGTYTAILQVTDDDGAVSMDSIEISVYPPLVNRDEWWMFGHEATHNRRSPFTGPTTNALKWSYTTGGSVRSSPAIDADGTIYVCSEKLYAFNPDGTAKWSFTTDRFGGTSPAISEDGTVYIDGAELVNINSHIFEEGKLYAINSDGTLNWSFSLGFGVPSSSPAIGADGTIYVGGPVNDYKLYAINSDGTLKWSYATGGYVSSSPAIGSDGTIYVGCYDRKLYAFNPDGTLKWSYQTGGSIPFPSPAVASNGTIYISCYDRKLYAINLDGTLKWSYETGSPIYSSPAVASDGTVYVGSNDNKLHALNPDGSLKWSYLTGGTVFSSPSIGGDGTIYVGSSDFKLYAINVNGTVRWSYTTGGGVDSSPAIGSDGTVYVGSRDAKLYAIGPGEGI